MTNTCLSRQNFCHNKMFVVTNIFCNKTFVVTKNKFVTTKFCHNKHPFVMTKIILGTAPTNDSGQCQFNNV